MRQGLGYFFSSLLACGWIFLLFSSPLLSAVSTEMWEFANLSQWRGETRTDLGVLIRARGAGKDTAILVVRKLGSSPGCCGSVN